MRDMTDETTLAMDKVNFDQYVQLCKVAIENNLNLYCHGQSGAGKSSGAELAASMVLDPNDSLPADFYCNQCSIDDPSNPLGIPYPVNDDFDLQPIGVARMLLHAKRLTVCLLDELPQAPPAVQKGYMPWLLGRRFGTRQFPDCVRFLAAGNRKSDLSAVHPVIQTLKMRFHYMVELIPDPDILIRHMIDRGDPPELIGFLKWKPQTILDYRPTTDLVNCPSPRTLCNLADVMKAGIPDGLEMQAYTGACGSTFASDFANYILIQRKATPINAILADPDHAKVPDEPGVVFSVATSLVYKADFDNMERIIAYLNRLPEEYGIFTMLQIFRTKKDLNEAPGVRDWITLHQNVLLGQMDDNSL